MKAVFAFPPIWTKKSPSTGISSISGYLKTFGYDTKIFDLNIDYYNTILNDLNYNKAIEYAAYLSAKPDISEKERKQLEFFRKNQKIYSRIVNKVDESTAVVKSYDFYNDSKYKIAAFVIAKALELLSLRSYPFIIFDEKIENIDREMSYEDYKKEALNLDNIFYKFLKMKAEEIAKEKPSYAGVSVNFEGQMLAGLTLAHILKNDFGIKTALGGTHITRSMENIKRDTGLFLDFADFIMIGEGEIPSLRLLQMLEGKCSLEDVPSLIYMEGDGIKSTPLLTEQITTDFVQDFDYTTDKEYFLPEKVYPINISKGCYWGKCKFCDFSFQYTHKPLTRVINEIKTFKQKYNAKYFYLTDSALSPKTANEFADLLIKEELDIRYTTFLRFENAYDMKFLKKLYKSGLRCASWGLESGSQKVLDLMNKGTKLDVIDRILKDSAKLKIANRITIIYLFPGETFADFCETIDFLKKHQENIFFAVFHRYMLKRYSYIFKNMTEFGINLTTDEIKSEYHAFELGLPYNQADYNRKLEELAVFEGEIYKNPDETLLYFSNKEKSKK